MGSRVIARSSLPFDDWGFFKGHKSVEPETPVLRQTPVNLHHTALFFSSGLSFVWLRCLRWLNPIHLPSLSSSSFNHECDWCSHEADWGFNSCQLPARTRYPSSLPEQMAITFQLWKSSLSKHEDWDALPLISFLIDLVCGGSEGRFLGRLSCSRSSVKIIKYEH